MGSVGAGQQDRSEFGELVVKRLLLAALVVVFATSAFAQNLPPGKWWRRPEIVQSLNLAEDQQNKLEAIFRTASSDLIDLRGEVEKQNIALRGDLDQSQLDRATIRRDAQRLSDARTRLFERELMMLVDMRSVLNDSQWDRMRNQLDRFGAQQLRPRKNQR
jgi:Spy/CpxP family protein refolding chaperone